ncbi:MAG: hypothetical protein K6G04_04800 [Lachnospiraceae bacterium]|nr:hypothetical protein [Lachnospiraceae bacterium]
MTRFAYNDGRPRRTKKRWMAYLPLLFFAGIIGIFYFATGILSSGTTARQKESLEHALMNDITYCYATTGRYPTDLDYIKSTYGLTYDESLFFIDYHVQGTNIFPDVTILELK